MNAVTQQGANRREFIKATALTAAGAANREITDVLERSMTYDEVTEILMRVNSLGAKLHSSALKSDSPAARANRF
jgi:hypothetical protein